MILKIVVLISLTKGDLTLEGHEQGKKLVIISKTKPFRGGEKENVEYCGNNPIEFYKKFEKIVNAKVGEGFEIKEDKSFDDNLEKIGIVSMDSPEPPKCIKELSAFLAAEVHKSLKKEGFDVGDYSVCVIKFSREGEKILKDATVLIKFCRGGKPEDVVDGIFKRRRKEEKEGENK